MAEHQLPKLNTGVRFPSPAPHSDTPQRERSRVTFQQVMPVQVGGVSKTALLDELGRVGVQMNDYARTLFADDAFVTSADRRDERVAVVSLAEIGLPDGGTFDEITTAAQAVGLDLCPLEVAPHFRLQYLDQPKGPYLTVASEKLRTDETFPNGLYLRTRDDGVWLRGYCATPDVVFEPDFSDFAFLLSDPSSRRHA